MGEIKAMIFCTPKAIYSDSPTMLTNMACHLCLPGISYRQNPFPHYLVNQLQAKKAIAKGAKPITESELIALNWLIS